MYLEHFGLTEPPFKITPVTDFFFSGANRGEILDALVYAITDGEGIVKVTGEVGSGKTMLCRMLLERVPSSIKAIHLANPSMSRDELLYAIADRLGLSLEGQRLSVILQTLQNRLEEMYEGGERCVVLVDEAHAMPLDTLEELRLLYNLQVGRHKLIQIVLFGQPELDQKLAQSNMRQLKDRIVHHFSILPISHKVVAAYLLFRLRTAGYKGPNVFSPAAVLLIAKASQGLMRRVNILADKALLAAFVEDTHNVEVRHVQAAIRDSEMVPRSSWLKWKGIPAAAALALFTAAVAGAGWFFGSGHVSGPQTSASMSSAPQLSAPVAPASVKAEVVAGREAVVTTATPQGREMPPAGSRTAVTQPGGSAGAPPALADDSLLRQRLDATQAMLAATGEGDVSIQLFYTDDTRPHRMEGFLGRARKLGKLDDIYIVPIRLNGKGGYRVLYGRYPDSSAARAGMQQLPQRYKDAFAPTLHPLNGVQDTL